MARLICCDQHGMPVAGFVEFSFFRGNECIRREPRTLDADGSTDIPSYGGRRPAMANVTPADHHWSELVKISDGDVVHRFTPIDRPGDLVWWRQLVGRTSPQCDAGAGMRIGVVDLGFAADDSLGHVAGFDIEGRPIRGMPSTSHGYRVCKIIAERGTELAREGIAPASEIIFVDVSDDERPSVMDSEKVAPAIELLADEFGVDLINVSAGAYIDEDDTLFRDVLLKSIRYARTRGALTIAAAGNQPQPPGMPARFDEVVAVGAVGLAGLAPAGSSMAFYEALARDGGHVGSVPTGEVFHYVESCYGPGLDSIGPGVGLTLCYDDGLIIDYHGTSYAAPVVVGVLACRLAHDAAYCRLEGAERADFAEIALKAMCRDTGLPRLRQGWGLPMLVLSEETDA